MRIELTPLEARVIGALIEKEITTPDHYPLSLNALSAACNQKTNRDPVLELSEAEVQDIVDGLVRKHLVSGRSGFGSRVTKYSHRFCNVGFGSLELSPRELGIVCVLLLRGPQTPGELRARAARLCDLRGVDQAESTLRALMERSDGPFVARLPREAGRREARYAQLFTGEPEAVEIPAGPAAAPAATGETLPERVERLELEVQALREELDELRRLTRGEDPEAP
jgi:uncharacterized protein YceH (UPF0502 family)